MNWSKAPRYFKQTNSRLLYKIHLIFLFTPPTNPQRTNLFNINEWGALKIITTRPTFLLSFNPSTHPSTHHLKIHAHPPTFIIDTQYVLYTQTTTTIKLLKLTSSECTYHIPIYPPAECVGEEGASSLRFCCCCVVTYLITIVGCCLYLLYPPD